MPQQGGINAPYTRFRGPVLVGQSSDFGIAAVNGGSTAPLISFWNASEHGLMVQSSADTRYVIPSGNSALVLTSVGVGVVTTGVQSTGGVAQGIYIPQTTGQIFTSSGGGAAAPSQNSGAYLIFDAGRNKLCIYSTAGTAAGWFGTAPMTSS